MAGQYWVGDFYVDVTRNQITKKSQSQSIPPKALAVLTCLAKNANKVVSHDQILSEVWPETVVTPNTLQRSIAQLRKALGEDCHFYIKTHAKQGYSLEVDVRWEDKPDEETSPNSTFIPDNNNEVTSELTSEAHHATTVNKNKSRIGFLSLFAAATMLSFIGYFSLTSSPSLNLNITEFNSLTANDHKEHNGIYSPDGQYVVFQRYSESICWNNNIWAKNTATQEETQLTKTMAAYGSHSFSSDGKRLAFIESDNCDKPITQKHCYKLMSMDFQQALNKPQTPKVLVECKNSRIMKPKWLNNNDIALMQEFSNRWKLIRYSIAENSSSVIYELEQGNIINYDYSPSDNLIAITRVHSDGQQYIDVIEADGQLLSSHLIELPEEIPANRNVYANFSPYPNKLIFSTGRQLFTLTYQGEVESISLPLNQATSSPIFHPSEDRMLVIKGFYDSDIASIPLIEVSPPETVRRQLSDNLSIIERSTKGEDNAQFQPAGELIAFESSRSGKNQLWVTDGITPRQLSDFPMDTQLYGSDWAANGDSILVSANKELVQIFLDSRIEAIPFEHPIEKLLQWNSEGNTALLSILFNGVFKLVELDLSNGKYKIINNKKVNWAAKTEDGRLVYTDQLDRFWQSGPFEDQLIESLVGHGSDTGFVIRDNVIYGVSEEFKLWAYRLEDNSFEVIDRVPETIDYITDINQTSILLTLRIAAKKEVAEIIFTD